MSCYIIHYRLRKEIDTEDYKPLKEAIQSYENNAHILTSCWAVVTTDTPRQIYDKLSKHIDSNDGLFIVKSGRDAIWIRVACPDKWLKDNL